MIAAWRTRWQGLARRDRIALLAAACVVAAALLYSVGIEPAWRDRTRLLRELPRLRDDAARIAGLKDAALALRAQGLGTESLPSLRDAAQRSTARAGIAAAVTLTADGALHVAARGTAAGTWFPWLESFARDARLRIVTASTTRTAAGVIDADVRLAPSGR